MLTPPLAGTLALVLALGIGIAAHPASAAEGDSSAVAATNARQTEDAQEALDYWTEERLAEAEAVTPALETTELVEEPDTTSQSRAAAPKLGYDADGEPLIRTYMIPTVGHLYFIGARSGEKGWCTATVVDTPNERTIITAGHCLHGGKDSTFHTKMIFIPAYDVNAGNPEPYGRYPVEEKRVFKNWASKGGAEDLSDNVYDIGFATVGDSIIGESPVEAIGGASNTLFNLAGTGYYANIYGYPEDDGEGETPYVCYGPTARKSFADAALPFLTMTGCGEGFGHGASGGPWLAFASDDATDFGTVLTVMSFRKLTTLQPTIWGGIFPNGDARHMMLRSPLYTYLWVAG